MELLHLLTFDLDAFFMVIFVDLVLSGDNAIVIGMAAASLPPTLRKKAIAWGIGIAVGLRIILASLTFYLLQIIGIKILGSILLLFVCYSMWRDLLKTDKSQSEETGDTNNSGSNAINNQEECDGLPDERKVEELAEKKKISILSSRDFRRAMLNIIIADISMSLDNVLAVAGIARDNVVILVFGLILSIVLMAIGATFVAKMLEKFHWLGYLGLLIILYVALDMGYDGINEMLPYLRT
tara:strand:+ start:120 stop:836 length:717 start_codon:yes stop_codon:yes gene_type:complete